MVLPLSIGKRLGRFPQTGEVLQNSNLFQTAPHLSAVHGKIIEDIRNVGWHVIHVMEDSEGPSFTYSVGLHQSYSHPELILFGLPRNVAPRLIDAAAEEVRKGRRFVPGGIYEKLLENQTCTFRKFPRREYPDYLGQALHYYGGDDFIAHQMIYPDREGRWPWQAGASESFRAILLSATIESRGEWRSTLPSAAR